MLSPIEQPQLAGKKQTTTQLTSTQSTINCHKNTELGKWDSAVLRTSHISVVMSRQENKINSYGIKHGKKNERRTTFFLLFSIFIYHFYNLFLLLCPFIPLPYFPLLVDFRRFNHNFKMSALHFFFFQDGPDSNLEPTAIINQVHFSTANDHSNSKQTNLSDYALAEASS